MPFDRERVAAVRVLPPWPRRRWLRLGPGVGHRLGVVLEDDHVRAPAGQERRHELDQRPLQDHEPLIRHLPLRSVRAAAACQRPADLAGDAPGQQSRVCLLGGAGLDLVRAGRQRPARPGRPQQARREALGDEARERTLPRPRPGLHADASRSICTAGSADRVRRGLGSTAGTRAHWQLQLAGPDHDALLGQLAPGRRQHVALATMVPPSLRARKAAATAADLMPAPVRSSSRARRAQSSSLGQRPARRRPLAPSRQAATARSRSSAPGGAKSMMKREAPHERGVEVPLAVGGQHGQAVELLHPLEHVVDLDVRVPVVRVTDLGPLAEQRVRLVEQQQRPGLRSQASNTSRRCFSVSPMYLLTTPARSTRYRSSPSERARTCAAIVLPVPLGPANRAVVPRPSEVSREKPQSSRTWPRSRACASSSRRWAAVAGGEHEVGPGERQRQRAEQVRGAGHQQPPADFTDLIARRRQRRGRRARISAGRRRPLRDRRGRGRAVSDDHSRSRSRRVIEPQRIERRIERYARRRRRDRPRVSAPTGTSAAPAGRPATAPGAGPQRVPRPGPSRPGAPGATSRVAAAGASARAGERRRVHHHQPDSEPVRGLRGQCSRGRTRPRRLSSISTAARAGPRPNICDETDDLRQCLGAQHRSRRGGDDPAARRRPTSRPRPPIRRGQQVPRPTRQPVDQANGVASGHHRARQAAIAPARIRGPAPARHRARTAPRPAQGVGSAASWSGRAGTRTPGRSPGPRRPRPRA